jgi:hypothetical protein
MNANPFRTGEQLCEKLKMFGPKQHERAPLRDKTPFLTPSLESNEGLEPRMLLDERSDESESVGESRGTTDLLIQGLTDRLPQPDSTWSLDRRAKWLQTAASIFSLVYKADDGERREISIVLAKEDAADQFSEGPVPADFKDRPLQSRP